MHIYAYENYFCECALDGASLLINQCNSIYFKEAHYKASYGSIKFGETQSNEFFHIGPISKSLYIKHNGHTTYFDNISSSITEIEQYPDPIHTMFIDAKRDIKEALRLVEIFKPKQVSPYNLSNATFDPIEFCRQVMLNNLSVPKIIKGGQFFIV